MRRRLPILHIAIVSHCENTANDLAEGICRQGQAAQIFNDARALSAFAGMPLFDVILLDRRDAGFAMTLSALRAKIRDISCYAVLCGFGTSSGIVPAGLDHAFDEVMSDDDLVRVLTEAICTCDDDVLSQDKVSDGQLWC